MHRNLRRLQLGTHPGTRIASITSERSHRAAPATGIAFSSPEPTTKPAGPAI